MTRTKYDIAMDLSKLIGVISDTEESDFIRQKALLAAIDLKKEFKTAETRINLNISNPGKLSKDKVAKVQEAFDLLGECGFHDITVNIYN